MQNSVQRRSCRRPVWVIFAALVLVACREDSLANLHPPDVSALQDAYLAPTAAIDATGRGAGSLAQLVDELSEIGLFCGWNQLVDFDCGGSSAGSICPDCLLLTVIQDTLNRLRVQVNEAIDGISSPSLGPVQLTGANVGVTRRCQDSATASEQDGELQLYLTLEGPLIGEVVWGEMRDCQQTLEGESWSMRGRVQLVFDSDVSLGDLPNERWIFAFDGDIGRGAFDSVPITLDLQTSLVAGSDITFRVPADDGDFFVDLTSSGWAIRGSNGTWRCDGATQQCSLEAAGR